MPRTKTEISARAKKKIEQLVARGGTADSIAKALRAAGIKGVSARTIGRRIAELRGPTRAPRGTARAAADALREEYSAAAAAADDEQAADAGDSADEGELPDPKAIPENADLDQINAWLKRADTLGKAAFTKGDLEGMGKMGRLTSALLEAKRKATPLEKEDPNDSPDMRKLGDQVEVRLLKIVDDIVKGR